MPGVHARCAARQARHESQPVPRPGVRPRSAPGSVRRRRASAPVHSGEAGRVVRLGAGWAEPAAPIPAQRLASRRFQRDAVQPVQARLRRPALESLAAGAHSALAQARHARHVRTRPMSPPAPAQMRHDPGHRGPGPGGAGGGPDARHCLPMLQSRATRPQGTAIATARRRSAAVASLPWRSIRPRLALVRRWIRAADAGHGRAVSRRRARCHGFRPHRPGHAARCGPACRCDARRGVHWV